ncbi:MAG: cytochrome c maturation protein CcmE [Myxococcales bacterium]|jgi:cytochrome c-type biogenesis protein CcmE|nr:cytochrome c maturation protein CcmE [Myxococcales bacterium]
MTDLDEELRQAVAESEAEAAQLPAAAVADVASSVDVPAVHGSDRSVASRRRNIGLLAGLLILGGGILTLVLGSADQAAIYSVPTDELVAKRDEFATRTVRVEGTLVKGSLLHRAEPCEYRFSMEKNGARLPVRYAHCIVPDTFRDVPDMDVEVTAEGKLSAEGYFEASHIMAKCPSKYEMRDRAANGEKAPHATSYGAAEMEPAGVP